MNPEFPYLLAGTLSLAAGWKKQGGFPSNGGTAVIATLILVLVASLSAGTKVAPVLRGFGWLLVFAAGSAAVLEFSKAAPKPKKTTAV